MTEVKQVVKLSFEKRPTAACLDTAWATVSQLYPEDDRKALQFTDSVAFKSLILGIDDRCNGLCRLTTVPIYQLFAGTLRKFPPTGKSLKSALPKKADRAIVRDMLKNAEKQSISPIVVLVHIDSGARFLVAGRHEFLAASRTDSGKLRVCEFPVSIAPSIVD